MKTKLKSFPANHPLVFVAVVLLAMLSIAAVPPYIRNVLTTNDVTLGTGLSISAGDVLSASGVGNAPGGNSGAIQFNQAGAFAGTNNLVFDRTNIMVGIGTNVPSRTLEIRHADPRIRLVDDALQIGEISETSIGTVSDLAFNIVANNAARWQFGGSSSSYLFQPVVSNAYDLGRITLPVRTNYANDFVALETVSTPVLNLTGGTNGSASFYDVAGTEYSQFLAPPNIQTNNVNILWSNATAGVVVAQPAGVGSNQLENIKLTAGQYVTWNGTAHVASNLPAGGGSQTPWTSNINGDGFSLTNVQHVNAGTNINTPSQNPTLNVAGTNSAGTLTAWEIATSNSLLRIRSSRSPTAVEPLTLSTNGVVTAALTFQTGGGAAIAGGIVYTVGNSSGRVDIGAGGTLKSRVNGILDVVDLINNNELFGIALGGASPTNGLIRFQSSSIGNSNGAVTLRSGNTNTWLKFGAHDIGTRSTNWTEDATSFVGYTNTTDYNQIWNIRGTSGNIVFWNRTGLAGNTAAGIAIWTNTIVSSGRDVVVGVNCGLAIDTGVSVVGGGRAF